MCLRLLRQRAGIFSSFLTVEKAKSDSGTFDGADYTAAESLPQHHSTFGVAEL